MAWTTKESLLDSWQRYNIFSSPKGRRPASGPTQPPIQWVKQALYLKVKQLGCDADHLPPPNTEVTNKSSCNSTPSCLHSMHSDNSTCTFTSRPSNLPLPTCHHSYETQLGAGQTAFFITTTFHYQCNHYRLSLPFQFYTYPDLNCCIKFPSNSF